MVHSAAADTSACFAVCSDRAAVDGNGTAASAAQLIAFAAAADTCAVSCACRCGNGAVIDGDVACRTGVSTARTATADTCAVSCAGCGNRSTIDNDDSGTAAFVCAATTADTCAVSVAGRRNDTAVDGNRSTIATCIAIA